MRCRLVGAEKTVHEVEVGAEALFIKAPSKNFDNVDSSVGLGGRYLNLLDMLKKLRKPRVVYQLSLLV